MQKVAVVTDSTAGIPGDAAEALGIAVVPASYAFEDQRSLDGASPWKGVYERITRDGRPPRAFGVAEAAFREAFEAGLERCGAVFCLVTPFDVNPSFTTACAAQLAIQFDAPDAQIKVANAGVGSAGLGALVVTLARMAGEGAKPESLLAALDQLEPGCDAVFVPETASWLDRAGKLAGIEERIGEIEDGLPVVRVGTRLTGVALADDLTQAEAVMVARVGQRAGAAALNAIVLHAAAPERAAQVAEAMRAAYDVRWVGISDLPVTHGALLGPGAVGVGVCPLPEGGA